MNKKYSFKALLTNLGWIENPTVTVDNFGIIKSIESQVTEKGEIVNGFALPGFQNAHSHAFQYAMAGLAELHSGDSVPDDFWSWRNAMYNLALTISPKQMQHIATMLYSEMLRHGYTSVAEFHYLHHDKNGNHYSNLAEMAERLMAAADIAGIRITLVPIFYQQGNFGQDPGEKQKRFISTSIEEYYKLLESTEQSAKRFPTATVATGIHSLRAVKPVDVIKICADLKPNRPFHIHVSEQLKEIDDCLDFHQKRPVQWLLDNCDVNENYHLVHATHLDESEISGIASAKANVVLCPSTEGNLGDGLFPFEKFKNERGRWSIGTDSHIGINPFEELRLLDYGQRLISHKRTTFFSPNHGDSGFNAIETSWKSGRKAMGASSNEFFEIGQPFDALIMDAKSPLISTSSPKNRCNTFVYSADVSNILGTIVNGKWIVKNQINQLDSTIMEKFIETMNELGSR